MTAQGRRGQGTGTGNFSGVSQHKQQVEIAQPRPSPPGTPAPAEVLSTGAQQMQAAGRCPGACPGSAAPPQLPKSPMPAFFRWVPFGNASLCPPAAPGSSCPAWVELCEAPGKAPWRLNTSCCSSPWCCADPSPSEGGREGWQAQQKTKTRRKINLCKCPENQRHCPAISHARSSLAARQSSCTSAAWQATRRFSKAFSHQKGIRGAGGRAEAAWSCRCLSKKGQPVARAGGGDGAGTAGRRKHSA